MKTLVLCVDRDNDIGTKTDLKPPIVGRKQNIDAAISLGVKDPEDPDTNAILAAVSIYDNLLKTEGDVEIATICGDVNVGVVSDNILAQQLEDVIKSTKPDCAILVSDGIEDEYVFPIVSSRLKVNSVRRVLIKQSQTIESTYYMLLKTLQNERLRKKIVIPIGLALLIIGLFAMIPTIINLTVSGITAIGALSTFGLAVTAAVLGFYLLNYVYRFGVRFSKGVKRVKYAILTAKLTFFFSIAAIVVLLTGLLIAYNATLPYKDFQEKVLVFGNKILIWCIIGAWIYCAGNAIDAYLKRGRMHISFYIITISLIALGLIMYAALGSMQVVLRAGDAADIETLQVIIYTCIISGLVIAIIGALLHRAVRIGLEKDARWRR